MFGERDDPRWGLERNEFAVVAHSGSRGLGTALALRWGHECLRTPEQIATYLGELAGACRYARANRVVLCWHLLDAIGSREGSAACAAASNLIHNDVERERELWVHRKGCAPAHADRPTVVLGTRGTATYVMRGLGHDGCLCSVAHGAGRRMTRSEARSKIAHKHARKSLTRTACGSRVICDDKDLLYEEHPDAYKDIDEVVESLEQAGAATRVASLVPMFDDQALKRWMEDAMRKDMNKLLCERPRLGWRLKTKRMHGRHFDWDAAPKRGPMPGRLRRTKILNENLQPLERFLSSKVGPAVGPGVRRDPSGLAGQSRDRPAHPPTPRSDGERQGADHRWRARGGEPIWWLAAGRAWRALRVPQDRVAASVSTG